jgi:hypothetical protein
LFLRQLRNKGDRVTLIVVLKVLIAWKELPHALRAVLLA